MTTAATEPMAPPTAPVTAVVEPVLTESEKHAQAQKSRSKFLAQVHQGDVKVDILGDICYWNIREINIHRDRFIEALKTAGIDERYAREHNYRSALIRAMNGLEEDRIIRRVKEDRVTIVIQFTAEKLVESTISPRLDYTPQVTVTVDKEAYNVFNGDFAQAITRIDDPTTGQPHENSEDIKKQLVTAFEIEKNTYKSSDITRYIQRIFEDQADILSLRPQGSIYFVPGIYRSVVIAVNTLVSQLGAGATFEYIPIIDVETARKTIGDSFAEEIAGILGSLDQEIKQMNSGDKEITEKWVEHRRKAISKAKQRIDMYWEVLGAKAGELVGQFDMLAAILKPRTLDIS